MMKKLFPLLVLCFLFVLASCSRCGPDIFLGSFDLMPESLTDWLPHDDAETLTFLNPSGDSVTLNRQFRNNSFDKMPSKVICSKGYDDIAAEKYNRQLIDMKYEYAALEVLYVIQFLLFVDHIENKNDLTLFDNFICTTFASYRNGTGHVSGGVQLIGNERGGSFTSADRGSVKTRYTAHSVTYTESVQINDSIYHNIYYSYYAGTPSIFVQKGRGVIAFQGMNNDIWVLQ